MDFRTWIKNNGDASYLAFTGNDGKIDTTKGGYDTAKSSYLNNDRTRGLLQGQVNQWYNTYNDNLRQNFGSPSTGSGSGFGGGSDSAPSAPAYDPAAMSYFDDQANLANSALGRIGTQRQVGQGNIESSYNSALNKLMGSNALAERNYGTTKTRAVEDNRSARNSIDTNVARQSSGLQRLLGSAGAGSSSASKFLAPFAVARQGTQQLNDVQTKYGRNMQDIDTGNQDRLRQFEEGRGELSRNRGQKLNELEGGLKQTEAGILEQLSNLALRRSQAKGQSYDQVRGELGGFNSRINSLLSQIDNLGRVAPVNPVNDVRFNAPDLAQYDVDGIQINPGQATPGYADILNPIYNLLGEEERRNPYGV